MRMMQLEVRDGIVVKSDGWESGVGYHYVYEVMTGLWLETMTNLTWPG